MEDRQGPPERPGAQGCERPRGAVSQPLSSATQAGSFFSSGGSEHVRQDWGFG